MNIQNTKSFISRGRELGPPSMRSAVVVKNDRRGEAAILAEINDTANALHEAWRVGSRKAPDLQGRLDRLYGELRAERSLRTSASVAAWWREQKYQPLMADYAGRANWGTKLSKGSGGRWKLKTNIDRIQRVGIVKEEE